MNPTFDQITKFIQTVGFPIAMCFFFCYYMVRLAPVIAGVVQQMTKLTTLIESLSTRIENLCERLVTK